MKGVIDMPSPLTNPLLGASGPSFPTHRPRRLRRSASLRALTAETHLHPKSLIQPLFVREGLSEPKPIASMPGMVHHTRESLRKAAVQVVTAGVGGLMLFGIPIHKDPEGTQASDPDGIVQQALSDVVTELGDDVVVMGDINLDEYTDHGHSGVLGADGHVDNDRSLLRFAEVAVAQARAGAHVVAPSGMMDGQIGAIRHALDEAGFPHVAILGYSAKYASSYYGPFRDAVKTSLVGDRKTYQQYPGNVRESLREVRLDIAEGVDMIMVKPAMGYLDIVRLISEYADVPVAAYQVSGEYSMIEAAAANGWISRENAILESLISIRRAGATMILSYWSTEFAHRLR
jgi:porphobilinogen synthase